MRFVTGFAHALLVLLLVAAPLPAIAGRYVDGAALDELFDQLRATHDATEAEDLTGQIWSYWLSPDDAELKSRMDGASVEFKAGDVGHCLTILDSVVKDFPDYAEGWNQRATVYYIVGRLDDSLSDISKVLALEPRHFGALSGRVAIYLKQGRRDAALADMKAALAIDPYLPEKAYFPELADTVTRI